MSGVLIPFWILVSTQWRNASSVRTAHSQSRALWAYENVTGKPIFASARRVIFSSVTLSATLNFQRSSMHGTKTFTMIVPSFGAQRVPSNDSEAMSAARALMRGR